MQLGRLVEYHKALADPTRVRILVLLSKGPLHGQALAGKLGVTPPTITHHMSKLRDASLVKERRDKNTIYFHLDHANLTEGAQGIFQILGEMLPESVGGRREVTERNVNDDRDIVENFLTPEGKLKHLPAKHSKKLVVLAYLLKDFKMGVKYPEREVNEMILRFHDDYATIRREFIIHQFMYRENSVYELNPREMWPI